MAPQALPRSSGTNDAFTPTACPQDTSGGLTVTEGCLTLNVNAPENATNSPVFVWIHGDSFTAGPGMTYDATTLVITSIIYSVPIVVVTINYRLGFLGFLAHQALFDEKSGNNNRSTTGNYMVS